MPLVNGGTSVKFKNTELQSAAVLVKKILIYGGLSKDIGVSQLARGNRSRRTNINTPIRVIPCSGTIEGTNLLDLKNQVDAFNKLLEGEGNLDVDIDQLGNYRRWIAEPGQIDLTQNESLLAVDFSFSFNCYEPYGRDTSVTAVNTATATTASSSITVNFGGTRADVKPVITVTITSATVSAINTLTFTNPATGQAISISRTWTAGEVLTIDFNLMKIQIAGVDVDYQGPLVGMSWAIGAGSVNVTNDFSARSLNYVITNLNQYK